MPETHQEQRSVKILGTRGIPAHHGGFETFAEHLAIHLAKSGWQVTVYCQEEGGGEPFRESSWQGVRLVHVPVSDLGALGTVVFDWKSSRHAARSGGLILTFGYNTAVFGARYWRRGIRHLTNMDGMEWKRGRYNWAERMWLYFNEKVGCRLASHLIADHPEIEKHLATRVPRGKITTIPYGADPVDSADEARLPQYGLEANGYALVVARPHPENSILETVRAFTRRDRSVKLVVLGDYQPEAFTYHRKVMEAATDQVVFLGAVYCRPIVSALRYFARLYVHGHTVGGTNPSLVEAMAAGCAVLSHDNDFNRWVAGPCAAYFHDEQECASLFDQLLDDQPRREAMQSVAKARHRERFLLDRSVSEYERTLSQWLPPGMEA